MNKFIYVIIFVILSLQSGNAQSFPDFKFKEILKEGFIDMDDPNSWTYRYKTQFQYNGRGLVSHSNRYQTTKTYEDRLVLDLKSTYRYDIFGREVFVESVFHEFPSGDPDSKTTSRYEYNGAQLTLEEHTYFDIINQGTSIERRKYDSAGRILEETSGEHRKYYTRDQNGCLVEALDSFPNYITKSEFEAGDDCEPSLIRNFVFDPILNEFIFESTWKFDRQYDARNNLIKFLVFYKQMQNQGFNRRQEEISTYDDNNRLTFQHHIFYENDKPLHQFRSWLEYDHNDNLIYAYNEDWNIYLPQWIPSSESYLSYDDNNQLIHGVTNDTYSLIKEKFLAKTENVYAFNELELVTYHYYLRADHSQELPSRFESELINQYACDGRITKSTYREIENNGGFTYEYYYYDTPICDPNADSIHSLNAFPNPTSGPLHLAFSPDHLPADISLYDMSGRIMQGIYTHTGTFYSMDISHLMAGIYILAVDTGEERIQQKIIKY